MAVSWVKSASDPERPMGRKEGTEEVLHQPGEEPGALPEPQERTFVGEGGHGGGACLGGLTLRLPC